MSTQYTCYKRFTKALITWLKSSATIVSLTGDTALDPRIYVKRGNEEVKRPSLVVDLVDTQPFLFDADGVFTTEVQVAAYTDSRIDSLDLAGAVTVLAQQNPTTLVDAGFNTDNIRTKSIRPVGIISPGESLLDPTSVRRTERSDVVAPDRYIAIVPIIITWMDTTP